MVSKIAVVAIVALVAIPVGLGYALNFQDVETTKYENLQTTNVSQFLHNGQRYDYVNANIYDLNGQRWQVNSNFDLIYPDYNVFTTAKSSINFWPGWGINNLQNFQANVLYYQAYTDIDVTSPYLQLSMTVTGYNTSDTRTFTDVIAVSYDSGGLSGQAAYNVPLKVLYRSTIGGTRFYVSEVTFTQGINTISYTTNGYYTGTPYGYVQVLPGNLQNYYRGVSIADGFSLNMSRYTTDPVESTWVTPGSGAEKIILTLDISSLNGTVHIRPRHNNISGENITLTNDGTTATFAGQEIITGDPDNSAYQLIIDRTGAELHYIGKWPTQIGQANYYRSWVYTFDNPISTDEFITHLMFLSQLGAVFDKVRFDYAAIKSAPIPSIVDRVYNPATITGFDSFFTTIKDISYYGPSLSFAGNTYTVSKGNLVLNENKSVSVNNIKFTSEKNAAGTYDNKINDYVISTTATPSTITFNGTWSANVATTNMRTTTSVSNQWVAGEWSWNGLDSNFAIIGLMSCIGVFIGLGIYGQRSGKKMGTLMLICAGGAFVFLALLQ